MKCETCRWWEKDEDLTEMGRCRVNPPTPDPEHQPSDRSWPVTFFNDWCGHWQGHVLQECKSDDNEVSGGETVE